MPLQPKHLGLYFSREHIRLVQEHRDQEPIDASIRYLKDTTSDDPLVSAQLAGHRYRFLDDDASGQEAVRLVQQAHPSATTATYQETVKSLLVWLSVIECIRTHPAWAERQQPWFDSLRKQLTILNTPPEDATLLDELWVGALNIGAGVVLEDGSYFERGADVYRMAIEEHIHPEGYLKGIVDVDNALDTYRLQVSGTGALVLMAEMAAQADVDLWSINNRGVTPVTAATYLLYYYFYPEKWKWEDDLTREMTESIIRIKGAFIEMVNRRSPMRGVDILLDEQRPFFGVYCGGLTTLTHGMPAPQKKRRWRLFGD